MAHPDRKRFDRDVLPLLRAQGFAQEDDRLYQAWVNYGVESEFAGREDDTDEDMLEYLRLVLA